MGVNCETGAYTAILVPNLGNGAGEAKARSCLPHALTTPRLRLHVAEINECDSDPCQNGATCSDFVDFFNCTCVAGYEGTLCETGACRGRAGRLTLALLLAASGSRVIPVAARHQRVCEQPLPERSNLHGRGQWLHLCLLAWVHWQRLCKRCV